ncbi:MarR family transcriptional regulator [Ahrensia marina]|uniref:MarR family winged helix-turn-helix transcriptional regulator n=1 Tax=Ahrensia marina TaxID=1514904 RepID=UPI0035CEF4FD
MSFNQRKTVTYRLVQASKAYRQRAANILSELNLHPGQDQILKALAGGDGQTMGALASALSVQPPTITKMVVRLGTQGMVERRPSLDDGRSSKVFLTEKGSQLIGDLDTRLKRMEQEALKGFEDKDRKRLRKALIQLEKNLSADTEDDPASSESP